MNAKCEICAFNVFKYVLEDNRQVAFLTHICGIQYRSGLTHKFVDFKLCTL